MKPSKRTREKKSSPEIGVSPLSGQSALDSSAANNSKHSFPIVGIGASAGGLEALTSFIKALPPDLGMAFVFVPHLGPSRESAFTQILSRMTTMPVLQIQDGMKVEPNHFYVIPPNCDLTIAHGTLHLQDRELSRSVITTIDVFFHSLAIDQGSNAIGIVLSGTASDGTSGLAAIKGEDGITFAQDTATAKYDGMPASAIAAGCVDLVLPPAAIAQELARLRQHPYVAGSYSEANETEEKGPDIYMNQVFRLLHRTTKVDFSEYKPPTIRRRIQRRMALHKIEQMAEYIALLHRDRREMNALYQDLLINVTSFFRNPDAFDALKQTVYPAILKARGSSLTPIRIWVPGCSTGEEVYSHAISLVEFLGEERLEVPIQIFGTDLSESAIQRARLGVYKESIEVDVNPARLRRFFHKVEGGYQISKNIRGLCIFSTQNVFSDPPFSRIDLVSCRNVMIYLSHALQKKVIPIFHYALNPTGFLMVGNTEGLLGAGSELFEMVDKKQKIYSKKLVSTPQLFGFSAGQPIPEVGDIESSQPPARQPDPFRAPIELQREADRLLLTRYGPPAVVINDQLEIVQSRGRTGAFLELPAGKASLNLLKMARPGLLFELQSAIDAARKNGIETQRQNIHVEENGVSKIITLRVIPFKIPVQDRHSFLVIFEPQEIQSAPQLPPAAPEEFTETERMERDKLIAQLKQELAATKEYLQSIIETQEATNEELQSANEEIQSGNEELQSANEKLQTSKEELESANEELHTVNEEMQHRNDLLTQLNNDLTNLLNSVHMPMVMIGGDLSVRRFTPQAATVLGLKSSDIGRAMPRLKLKINAMDLKQVMLNVIHEVQPKQVQVQDHDGNWCDLRVTPYRTLDNRIDGVVLSVVDKIPAAEGPREKPAKKRQSNREKSSRSGTKFAAH